MTDVTYSIVYVCPKFSFLCETCGVNSTLQGCTADNYELPLQLNRYHQLSEVQISLTYRGDIRT